MMPYIHFTEEQKLRAGSVDLPEFFRRRGEKLLHTVRGMGWAIRPPAGGKAP